MTDSTRISELPDISSSNDNGNSYMPMNMHSNPYGNSMEGLQPYPQEDKKQASEIQRLPSRDIAMDTNMYTNDNEIKANYIPEPSKNIKDYVRDYEEEESERIDNHKRDKKRKFGMDELITHFQEIFLIGTLFFISQMLIINETMRKYCKNLGTFDLDGNINVKKMFFRFKYLFSSFN
jgi:hypothetical protein